MTWAPAPAVAVACVTVFAVSGAPAAAQQPHAHRDAGPEHHHGLHFSHPIFTESVSPDTKLRLGFGRAWERDASESEVEVEAEYAFHRSFSIEVAAPYAFVSPDAGTTRSALGNAELAFKFANYAFERHGLLLGYGVELGLPTGSASEGIGSDHIWEVEPFFNVGFKRGRLEIVGFSIFGIPTNQDAGDEFETEFKYDVSTLLHVTPQLQLLAELNGEVVMSGDEAGEGLVSIAPGVKLAPARTVPLFVGLAGSFPLGDEALDARLRFSLFYHF